MPSSTPHRFDRRLPILLAICLAAALGAGKADWLRHFDALLLDRFNALHPIELSDELRIVSIDQRAIDTLGRWPWPRDVQARLIDRLREQGAKVLVYDVMLSEPDREHPGQDRALARAIARHGHVVLPAQPVRGPIDGTVRVLTPLPLFQRVAHAIGADDIEMDDDGVVRRYYLEGGVTTRMWPSLAALLADSNNVVAGQFAESYSSEAALHWLRNNEFLIRYAGPPGSVPVVSAADVLDGSLPGKMLAGRKVIVGAMDASLGSRFAVPNSGGSALMSGIEIQAQAANAILHVPVLTGLHGTLCIAIEIGLGLLCALLLWSMRDQAVVIGVSIALALLAIAWFTALLFFDRWIPIVSLVLGVVVAGMYLESARAQRFRHDAQTDRLTQLSNRRSFDLEFDSRWERQRRSGGCLGLALVDIDFFKAYNDGYGHAAGDKVLAMVASIIKRCVGSRGTVSRFGGEEFAVLLPNQCASHARMVAEEIRATIEAHRIAHEHALGRGILTVSIGVATVTENRVASAKALFEYADQALYEAKRKGRNRVELAVIRRRAGPEAVIVEGPI